MAAVALFIVGLVVGIAAGAVLAGFRRASSDVSGPNAAPAPAADPPPAALPAPSEGIDLSSRFRPLRAALEAFGESASHPRQLRDLPEFREAVALLASPDVALDLLVDYACGRDWAASSVAYAALAERPDGADVARTVVARLSEAGHWPLHFALEFVARLPQRPPVGAVVLAPAEYWVDQPMSLSFFVEHFRQREALGDAPEFGTLLNEATADQLKAAEALLRKVSHPFAAALLDALEQWRARTLDRSWLAGVGRFWTHDEDALLIEHPAIRDAVATMEAAVTQAPARSVLLVGEARTGKTSVARCVARRLQSQGYVVFEAGGPDIMAGQSYFGEVEARVRQLVRELRAEKRVLWFVPSLLQLATSGMHRGQAASLLDQVMPAVVAGRLVLVSECSPGALSSLQQKWPILRTALEVLRVPPVSRASIQPLASDFAIRLAAHLKLAIDADVVPLAVQLAAQFLSGLQMPGSVLDLLKLASNWVVANEGSRVTRREMLAALSQVSGLPAAILDDQERIDLGNARRFFASRVIGQDEAVAAVVDRIAMLKAGLADPARPIAVFLFVGPTGTGKTELAKSLAEYLFGNPDRLIRLDMSEFQTYESVRKIVGGADEADSESLIQKIRRQPFSVLLLDEFEKANSNVWDLFLQVFDDGRLTDSSGMTADFRQAFIILTSNLGATTHRSAGLGFAPRADRFANEQVLRAVSQSFRPEFVNRIDKVIVFQPLQRDDMRGILRKELARIGERRGLRNRDWAIEWESSALEFLLDRGFSAENGARPLKRAIEQYVVAPLAATIVEHRFPSGEQFLFVRGTGDGIEVEFVDPDGDATAATVPADAENPGDEGGDLSPVSRLAAIAMAPAGNPGEREYLSASLHRVRQQLDGPAWEALRAELVAAMSAADFWSRPDRASIHSRFALMDRVAAAASTAESLHERLVRGRGGPQRPYSRDLARRLALQLLLVDAGLQDGLRGPPREVIVNIEPALEGGADPRSTAGWCEQLAGMYRSWARARRMQVGELRDSGRGSWFFVVTGFGAEDTLQREEGLHLLEPEGGTEDSAASAGRAAARVSVATRALSDASDAPTVQELAALFAALFAARAGRAAIVRRYRLGNAPLVRDSRGNWRTGRAADVLRGDFDLLGHGAAR